MTAMFCQRPKCDKCREPRPDVKPDPGTGWKLCNECWFHTNPAYEGPKNRPNQRG